MREGKRPGSRLFLSWFLRAIGPLLLLGILWQNRDQLGIAWYTLRGVRWGPLVLSAVLVFPFVLLKGWRWQLILDDLGEHVPWKRLTLYYALGIFLGAATPGQAGDFLKAWYLKEDGHDLGAALLSTVVDRLFDMGIMGLLALSGIYALWRVFPRAGTVLLLIAMLLGIAFFLSLLLSRSWRNWWLDRVFPLLVPAPVRRYLHEREVRSYLDRFFLSGRNLLLGGWISLLSFCTTFFRLWLLIPALGKSLPFAVFVPTIALVALGSLLSVAGLGTRELILLTILSAPELGWSRGEILSYSALILCVGLENLVVGLPLYLFRPLGARWRFANSNRSGGESPSRM
ncbi:MAG: lysylphosphatidylglycerol synthase transmembrane domain-containing protein [Chloroflexia bacterium]